MAWGNPLKMMECLREMGVVEEPGLHGDFRLDGQPVFMKQGTLIYIPGGVCHFIVNRSKTESFQLLTIWGDEKDNHMHEARIKAWGKSYMRADEG